MWSDACQQSRFENTMHALITALGLHITHPDGQYVVETNASSEHMSSSQGVYMK